MMTPNPADSLERLPSEVEAMIRTLIEKAHWQSAKSVEAVAPHQYVVIGWDKDKLTEAEFWRFRDTIMAYGRPEEWTPPEGFYDSGNRRPMRNRYLYVEGPEGLFAYWYTHPRKTVPMLNRDMCQSRSGLRHGGWLPLTPTNPRRS